MKNRLYENIKTLCHEKGMTISSLEKALFFGKNFFGKFRNGASPAWLENLKTTADYFHVSIDALLYGNPADLIGRKSLVLSLSDSLIRNTKEGRVDWYAENPGLLINDVACHGARHPLVKKDGNGGACYISPCHDDGGTDDMRGNVYSCDLGDGFTLYVSHIKHEPPNGGESEEGYEICLFADDVCEMYCGMSALPKTEKAAMDLYETAEKYSSGIFMTESGAEKIIEISKETKKSTM